MKGIVAVLLRVLRDRVAPGGVETTNQMAAIERIGDSSASKVDCFAIELVADLEGALSMRGSRSQESPSRLPTSCCLPPSILTQLKKASLRSLFITTL